MAKKPTDDERPETAGEGAQKGDSKKDAGKRVLIRPRAYRLFEQWCEENESDVAEEVNRMIKDVLKRDGWWQANGKPPGWQPQPPAGREGEAD